MPQLINLYCQLNQNDRVESDLNLIEKNYKVKMNRLVINRSYQLSSILGRRNVITVVHPMPGTGIGRIVLSSPPVNSLSQRK